MNPGPKFPWWTKADHLRRERGLSWRSMEAAAGWSPNSMKVAFDRGQNIGVSRAVRLAKTLDVDLSWLLDPVRPIVPVQPAKPVHSPLDAAILNLCHNAAHTYSALLEVIAQLKAADTRFDATPPPYSGGPRCNADSKAAGRSPAKGGAS